MLSWLYLDSVARCQVSAVDRLWARMRTESFTSPSSPISRAATLSSHKAFGGFAWAMSWALAALSRTPSVIGTAERMGGTTINLARNERT